MSSPPKTETSGSGGGEVGAELGVTTASDAGGVSAEAAVAHEEVAVSGEGGLQIEVEALLRCRTGAGLFAYEEGERSESQRPT